MSTAKTGGRANKCHSPFNWFQDWIGKRPSGWTKAEFNKCMEEFINEFHSEPEESKDER